MYNNYICVYKRDVGSHLNYEHRVFNSEEFLKTREPAEQLFYKTVKLSNKLYSLLKFNMH